jgi:hypothetical protein
MSSIATAVITGSAVSAAAVGATAAVIGAGAAIAGAGEQADAIDAAASTQAQSDALAIAEQRAAREQAVELNAPFREAGLAGLPQYQQMAMEGYQGPGDITGSPLYQWQLEQGTEGINRAAAARGGYGSTAAVSQIGDFTRALGAQETETQYNRGLTEYNTQYDRLMNLVNVGRGATTESVSAGQAAASNIGNITTAGGTNLANLQMASGANQASMYANLGALPMQAVNTYNTMQPQTSVSPQINYTPAYQYDPYSPSNYSLGTNPF